MDLTFLAHWNSSPSISTSILTASLLVDMKAIIALLLSSLLFSLGSNSLGYEEKNMGPKPAENISSGRTVNPNMTVADVRRRAGTQCSLNDSQLRRWQAPDNILVPLRSCGSYESGWFSSCLPHGTNQSGGWQPLLSAQGSRAACHESLYTKQNTGTPAPTVDVTQNILFSHFLMINKTSANVAPRSVYDCFCMFAALIHTVGKYQPPCDWSCNMAERKEACCCCWYVNINWVKGINKKKSLWALNLSPDIVNQGCHHMFESSTARWRYHTHHCGSTCTSLHLQCARAWTCTSQKLKHIYFASHHTLQTF